MNAVQDTVQVATSIQWGQVLALLGAAIAAFLAGIGSAKGVGMGGEASAGVLTENPDLYGKLVILQLLPGTQGIYGFLIAFLVLLKTNFLAGMVPLTVDQGLQFFIGCLPIAIVGLLSAIYQGRVAVSGINLVGRRPEMSG
nr:V-type ATP synthase subunit K [Clostridia bacterium]